MEKFIRFVGLDVHKEMISVALAEGGERGEARVYGEIANRPDALKKLVGKLARASHDLNFCYEAGPCSHVETLACQAIEDSRLLLEMANMRVECLERKIPYSFSSFARTPLEFLALSSKAVGTK